MLVNESVLNTSAQLSPDPLDLFSLGGEMGELMRRMDWTATRLGPVETWSPALRMMVRFLLVNRFPLLLWWGPDFCQLYNDAYRPILGTKHPQFLGKPVRECWSEIWHVLEPLIRTPFEGGPATWMEDIPLEINRYGFKEETHFTIAYSPVPDESAPRGIGGVLATVHEISEKVVGERRTMALRDLGAGVLEERNAQEACSRAAEILANYPKDVPFSLLYLLDADQKAAHLAGSSGVKSDAAISPRSIIIDPDRPAVWPLSTVLETGEIALVEDLNRKFAAVPSGPWSDPPHQAAVVPIHSSTVHQLAGFLVAGLSPRLRYDDSYRGFLDLASSQIATAVANGRAWEEERKRAEALAEIDRAKTTFFTNISHEFRTPLTLLLTPIEETLGRNANLGEKERADLEVAHRNAMRLLKLVNTLLDFARIEAGRIQAHYEPADLCALTSDLASMFRSVVERAGLYLTMECGRLEEPVYVDREMWEKIVLNLMSNAFKFTFEGGIRVALQDQGSQVELAIADTGTGIPESDLPRLFERFHRVEGASGRTFEGSGIGLALVQELVKLHGGKVSVESTPGRGSTFRVFIPKGKAHLPQEHIQPVSDYTPAVPGVNSYIAEALKWIPNCPEPATDLPLEDEILGFSPAAIDDSPNAADHRSTILLADDNGDMRAYLQKLLEKHYRVIAVKNGVEALQVMEKSRPDLILTDVMMPLMDGFELLGAVRDNPATRSVPIIILSARAGEEARIEGGDAGADDYLVKPFSTRELLARVDTHLRLARTRQEADALVRQNEKRFRGFVNASSDVVFRMSPDWTEMWQLDGRGFVSDTAGPKKNWIEEYIDPVDQPAILKAIRNAIQTKSVFELDHRIRQVDGTLGWTLSRAVPILDENGEIVEWMGAAKNVTASEEARNRLAAIVESSDDAIISKDLNGIVTTWNRQAQRLFGYKEEEMVGQSILTIIPPELQLDEEMILSRIRSGQKIDHFETVRITKSGERIEVALSISPVRDKHGNIVGAAKIAHDIRESKKIERTLRTTEKLAAAGRLAATVAHEINNPLEAVNNLVFLAKRDIGDPIKASEYLRLAERELDRVAHIARQTLGFYRDTSAATKFSVIKTIDDLLFLYEKRLEARNIRVIRQYKEHTEITAFAGEISQAFSNLISNAIDAMPSGGSLVIRVSQAREWKISLRPGVRVTILDTGSGIPLPARKSLFEPFFTTKADVGTGLGLWITKNIVEKHQGHIRFMSRTDARNHGTAFSIFLPSNAQEEKAPQLHAENSGRSVA